MSEQAPQQEITRIEDPIQAEAVAYATKVDEEAAVLANNRALEATSLLDQKGLIGGIHAKHTIAKEFNKAEKHRQTANLKADLWSRLEDTSSNSGADQSEAGRIQDVDKAWTMAHASKGQEEAASKARASGREAISNLHDKEWRKGGTASPEVAIGLREHAKKIGKKVLRIGNGRTAKKETTVQLKTAERARAEADARASQASEYYDRFNRPIVAKDYSDDSKREEATTKASRSRVAAAEKMRDLGVEAASHLGDEKPRSIGGWRSTRRINRQVKKYDRVSASASRKAETASRAFDRHQKFANRGNRKVSV